jgi:hypothetical protein
MPVDAKHCHGDWREEGKDDRKTTCIGPVAKTKVN